jgi:hypothetical protein
VSKFSSGHTRSERASQVPLDVVEALEEAWIRCRMAGKELARDDQFSRRLGWIATGLTAATSLGVFATLQAQDNDRARVLVGVVTAIAAVIGALQAKATKDAQVENARLEEVIKTFHSLHWDLLHAISEFINEGKKVAPSLMERARTALDQHAADKGGEEPTYDQAAESVARSMKSLGLIR